MKRILNKIPLKVQKLERKGI